MFLSFYANLGSTTYTLTNQLMSPAERLRGRARGGEAFGEGADASRRLVLSSYFMIEPFYFCFHTVKEAVLPLEV